MAVSRKLLRALTARDGHRSAWTGQDVETLVPHHRTNRGMGGDPSRDVLSNLVWLESEINALIEADAAWADEARTRGMKLRSGVDPAREPLWHEGHRRWVLLGDDGGICKIPIGALRTGARS